MSIPILTYHSLHAPGWNYAENDHVAFETDLKTIRELGFRVVRLAQIADALRDGSFAQLAQSKVVGLSFDDGSDHDYYDFCHPDYGYLKSMARILVEQAFDLALGGGQARATSFVIVSAAARRELDQTCIAGRGQWRDVWWYEANARGVLDIANHSWDHLHASLGEVAHSEGTRGNFHCVSTLADAEQQIAQAQISLNTALRELSCGLFAYPYGHVNAYLRDTYLPSQALVHAAFETGGRGVTEDSSIWAIPRFVCGDHWQTPDALATLLERAVLA
jgi:Polysaccharide deacetylase